MIRVVLAGGYDTQNLGDHAMLVILRQQLERRFGEAQITLLSRHPDPDFDQLYGVHSIPNLDHTSREAARGKWFRGLNGEADSEHLQDVAHAIREADLLIIGGGRMLVDYTHGFQRGHLAYFAQLTILARFLGVPMLLYAHSLEPLATESGREHLRFLAENAAGISVREEASTQVLRDLGIASERFSILPDPAFGLNLVAPYLGSKLPEWKTEPDARPLLALNLRSYAWRDGDVADFEERVAFLLDRVVLETGARLLSVPQMTYAVDSNETDDRAIARRIAGRMRRAQDFCFVEQALTVEECLGVYGHVTALLSMRRHGMLFAATQGVPVLPLSAERNANYMADSLGVGDLSVHLEDMEEAMAVISRVLADPRTHGQRVASRTGEVGQAIDGYGDWLADSLERASNGALKVNS